MKYYITLFLCACFFPVATVFASIRINEVAWMGTAASQYSEWIELYNDGPDAVSLDGWKIYKTGNTLLYTLSKSINAGGYVLVERITASAPDAVRGIDDEAGTFGGGGLRNTGEDLTLEDKDGNAVNILPFADGWPAGDAKNKDTMQWTGTKWITAPGTPDAQNAADNVAPAVTQQAQTQTIAVQTPVVETPVVTAPDPVISSQPAISTPVVQSPVMAVPAVVSPTIQIETPIVPVPVISAQPAAQVPPAAKKSTSTAKKSTYSIPSSTQTSDVSTDLSSLEDANGQEASADEKENNHIKIIIFGAVILIGMALFLLLERFKARQE